MYTVKGTVQLADGDPAIGTTILIFNRDLRSKQELGKDQTDKQENDKAFKHTHDYAPR